METKDVLQQRLEEIKDYKIYMIDSEFDILSYKDEEFIVRIISINHKFYNIKSFKSLKGAKKFIYKLKKDNV